MVDTVHKIQSLDEIIFMQPKACLAVQNMEYYQLIEETVKSRS